MQPCVQYVDVGHKKHLQQCSGSRKRKQADNVGHVEIEGLAALEAEEEQSMHGDEEEADTRPAKVWLSAVCSCTVPP